MWAWFSNQFFYQIFDSKECTLRFVKIHIASRFGNVMKTQSGVDVGLSGSFLANKKSIFWCRININGVLWVG